MPSRCRREDEDSPRSPVAELSCGPPTILDATPTAPAPPRIGWYGTGADATFYPDTESTYAAQRRGDACVALGFHTGRKPCPVVVHLQPEGCGGGREKGFEKRSEQLEGFYRAKEAEAGSQSLQKGIPKIHI